VVGSVTHVVGPGFVELRVAGDRAALRNAIVAAVVLLLGAATIPLCWYLTPRHVGQPLAWAASLTLLSLTAGIILGWCLGRDLRRFLRTTFRRVTFRVEGDTLQLTTTGYGRPTERAWRCERIDDVAVIARGGGGVHELRIVPADARPFAVLYGAGRDGLDLIASVLRDATGVTAREHALEDQTHKLGDDAVPTDGPACPDLPRPTSNVLDYAPEPKDDVAFDRMGGVGGSGDLRLLIPPLRWRDHLRQQRRGLIALAIIAPLAAGLLAFDLQRGRILLAALAYVAILLNVRVTDCFVHTSLEVAAHQLTSAMRWPGGAATRSWRAADVIDVDASENCGVTVMLLGGETVELAHAGSEAQAEQIASALRTALRATIRRRRRLFDASAVST
jgi:hypothetical protein